MSTGLPVDESRALLMVVGPYPVKIVASTAEVAFDFPGQRSQQLFEARLRIERRVDQDVVLHFDFNTALRESEWEACRKQKLVVVLCSSSGEGESEGSLHSGFRRSQRSIHDIEPRLF